jgi:hypothetical protein
MRTILVLLAILMIAVGHPTGAFSQIGEPPDSTSNLRLVQTGAVLAGVATVLAAGNFYRVMYDDPNQWTGTLGVGVGTFSLAVGIRLFIRSNCQRDRVVAILATTLGATSVVMGFANFAAEDWDGSYAAFNRVTFGVTKSF